MSLLSLLTDTCTIRRKTEAQATSTSGGITPTWADSTTGVACTVQHNKRPGGGSEQFLEGGREAAVTEWIVYLPYGTDVRFSDRLLITSGPANGITMACVADPVDDSGRGSHLRVDCQSVRGGGGT